MAAVPTSRFQTTCWSLVLAAAGQPTTQAREALSTLCRTYWHPVYSFIRRSGYQPDQAQDLTQGFFLALLEKHYVGDADRQRGPFRSFLLASVKHFLANQRDRANTLKRGGGRLPVSIDAIDAENWYARAVMMTETPERLFERRWALSLLAQVMARLREEFAAAGKAAQFETLSSFLNYDPEAGGYEALAARTGISPGALRTALHRLRQKYRTALRAEIAETVASSEEVNDEIRFLVASLGG